MAMAVMHRVTSGLFAAVLSAMVVGAASLHFREQSPPRATLAGRPPPLARATLEQRVDPALRASRVDPNVVLKVRRYSSLKRRATLRSANPEEGACVY
jgi:hypothetical protein